MATMIEVLKRPLTILRLIQLLVAIIAFASTLTFTACFTLKVDCPGPNNATQLVDRFCLKYPFSMEYISAEKTCSQDYAPTQSKTEFQENLKSASQFFVCMGIVSLMYCIVSLVAYLCLQEIFSVNTKVPIIDFLVTTLFGLLWLCASAAWAAGITEMKMGFNTSILESILATSTTDCIHLNDEIPSFNHNHCSVASDASFSMLNFSVFTGFLSLVLWYASGFFAYKQTVWYKGSTGGSNPQYNEPSSNAWNQPNATPPPFPTDNRDRGNPFQGQNQGYGT